jgi:hypothetical protein
MQRTSFGTITDCERSGRSGYFCKYVFPVDGEEYKGGDRVDSYRMFGQIVMVYYVSQEPSVSALEEFSQKSHRDRNNAYFFLLMIATLPGFILYSKAKYRAGTQQRTT